MPVTTDGPRAHPSRPASSSPWTALPRASASVYFLRPIWAIRWALAAALARRFLALAMLKRTFMMFVGTSRDSVNLVRRSLLALSWYSLPLSWGWGRYLYRVLPAPPPPPGAREGPLLLVFLLPLLLGCSRGRVLAGEEREASLARQGRAPQLALLGLSQGCVDAAEEGLGFVELLGEACPGGPEEQQQQEGGCNQHLSL